MLLSHDAICAINEFGRLNASDQECLLDPMEEGKFSLNKYGINAHISASTVILASANPIGSYWNDAQRVDREQFPILGPVLDRFDLKFIFRTSRDEDYLRGYAERKLENEGREIPDYNPYLRKHILYAKSFDPKLSDEAIAMLTKYYTEIAKTDGSPRVLDILVRLATALSSITAQECC